MSGKLDHLSDLFKLQSDIDTKSLDFLMNALKKSNQDGFDYIEFKQAYNALTQLPMEPDLAMKSAFTTGGTMGLNKEGLLKSAEFYKQVIQREKAQFDVALKNQREQKIENRKSEQKNIQNQIDRNKDLVNKLQTEIEELQKQIDAVDKEIDAAVSKIEDSRYKFEHAFSEIITEINKDIELINQNI
ncbi:MAG: hypothetical protein J5I59_00415 [Saprospiraceae bacterium]|nr:hypothetical protein [Saprospiraceae bacterium]